MRVLGAIVHARPLFVPAGQAKSLGCRAVVTELVRDRHPWRKAVLAEQPHSCPLVPARLDQDVEDFAFEIDSTPQIHTPAGDPHDHFIQVPLVTRSRSPLSQSSREERTEFQHPAPDRFVGQVEAAFGKELFDILIA